MLKNNEEKQFFPWTCLRYIAKRVDEDDDDELDEKHYEYAEQKNLPTKFSAVPHGWQSLFT